MCKVGGPRCPKEAGRLLQKALETYRSDPTESNRRAYHERLYQYQLTKRGLEGVKRELARLEARNTDKKAIKTLTERIDRLEWDRANMTQRKKAAEFCGQYIARFERNYPNVIEHWNSLIDEGTPLDKPNREAVKRWLKAANYEGDPIAFDGDQFYALRNLYRRCKHQQLIDQVDHVEMDKPGSQAEHYPRDENGRISEVYYASYGSNMNRNRFMTYIKGGSLPGSTRTYTGCQDDSDPQDDIPVKFNHPIFYAMRSSVWQGGIAFLDHSKEGQSLGRAYLISSQQFDDVIAQESGQEVKDSQEVDLDAAIENRVLEDYDRSYGTLVHVGDYNNRPVMTFTSPYNIEDAMYADRSFRSSRNKNKFVRFRGNSPSGSYMRMISSGIEETFGLKREDQTMYFLGTYGGNFLSKKTVTDSLTEEHKPAVPNTAAKKTTSTTAAKSSVPSSGEQSLFSGSDERAAAPITPLTPPQSLWNMD